MSRGRGILSRVSPCHPPGNERKARVQPPAQRHPHRGKPPTVVTLAEGAISALVVYGQHGDGFGRRGMSTSVNDLAARVEQAHPPGLTQSIAQIYIFEVHEVPVIKTIHRVERGSVDEQAAAGEPSARVSRRVIRGVVGATPRVARAHPAQQGGGGFRWAGWEGSGGREVRFYGLVGYTLRKRGWPIPLDRVGRFRADGYETPSGVSTRGPTAATRGDSVRVVIRCATAPGRSLTSGFETRMCRKLVGICAITRLSAPP